MRTKVGEIELSGGLADIPVDAAYERYHLLVRYRRLPIGWITITTKQLNLITRHMLETAIKSKLGTRMLHLAQRAQIMPAITAPPAEPEGISVIVCTRNRTQLLERCLHTLLNLDYPVYEIIVVDNAPTSNDTQELVASLPVRYVREERPGLDWARNRGITEAKYTIVAFTDDDAFADRFWLQAIATTFKDATVAAVTGLVAPAELETKAQQVFEFGYGGMGHGFTRRKLSRSNLSDRQLLRAASTGIGVNMAFRRDVFNQIGYFDTALDVGTPSSGAGDIEIFYRLLVNGHTFVYEPAMLVWHTHRSHLSELKKQIKDNGRSFGCYLVTVFKARNIKVSSITKFFLIDWLGKWHYRNFVKPRPLLSRRFVLTELAGVLQSPFAYRASQLQARRIAGSFKSHDPESPALTPDPANTVTLQQASKAGK